VNYRLQYRPAATDDLQKMSKDVAERVITKIEAMQNDLAGNVKRLRQFFPKYRLRATGASYSRSRRLHRDLACAPSQRSV
jgi:mRNA-degrading endonuclease RelE of RelBE toxin-antitoxin system